MSAIIRSSAKRMLDWASARPVVTSEAWVPACSYSSAADSTSVVSPLATAVHR